MGSDLLTGIFLRISVEISDSGPGIPAADKLRIFEPYYTTKQGGLGLGIAIVNTIVTDHQGDIRVFDIEPHGAKFIIDLPLSPQRQTQRRFSAA